MPFHSFLPHFLARQFKTPSTADHPEVVIPLEHAQRHHSVVEKAEKDGEKGLTPGDLEKRESSDDNGSDDVRRGSVAAYDIHTIEGLRSEIDGDITAFGLNNSAYDRMSLSTGSPPISCIPYLYWANAIGKSKIINKAIQDMGMGRYQWELFVLCGFGWFADNFWLQGVALTLPQLSLEFGYSSTHTRFTTFALFIGLCLGASFWGTASDVLGRRLAFNTTLFIGALFGTAVGGGNTWIAVCALFSCLGLGIGGNLPVDGALFLEFLPFASGNLLTLLSIWWPVGSLVASMIAWGLIPNYACNFDDYTSSCRLTGGSPPTCCGKSNNMGWRYFTYTLGAITFMQWILRFIVFQMYESPKFLLSRGRQNEAVAVVQGLAYKNKTQTWLTEEVLNEVGGYPEGRNDTKLSAFEVVRRSAGKFSTQRINPLFAHWKLGLTTGLLWFCWFCIGMGYPLFNAFIVQYLGGGSSDTYITYRNYAITNVVGVPGSLLAYYTVNIKYIGRKGTMAVGTLITGIFLFIFTTSTNSDFQLAFSSLVTFFQNIMYGVLYAYTPEVFPAPNRGTGTGIASMLNRVGGFCAPLIAIYAADADPKVPIYVSGALMLASFVAMCALPLETRGKQTL
ncbi:MAG: hypothetical protein Q9159_004202 [Coniocarpon cinnabarinum]